MESLYRIIRQEEWHEVRKGQFIPRCGNDNNADRIHLNVREAVEHVAALYFAPEEKPMVLEISPLSFAAQLEWLEPDEHKPWRQPLANIPQLPIESVVNVYVLIHQEVDGQRTYKLGPAEPSQQSDGHYTGSCLCGGVCFSVAGFSSQAANCHCSMCRKFHGAAFGTLVAVEGLRWLSGRELLIEFTAPNGTVRSFCSCCGSSVGFRVKGAELDEMELAIATFDSEIPVTIDAQIYTAYKANWCVLAPDLPAFPDGRDS